jgi:hypothetical protein
MRISLKRTTPVYVAFMMLFMLIVPVFIMSGGNVEASGPGQVQSRSIQMSDDTVNTSASTASYLVQFNVATTGVVEAIVVDFCNSDPIPGDVCTIPTGFSVGSTFTPGTNTASGWAASTANSNRTFDLSNASGGSIASGATMSFAITGVTNPTVLGTFYARIFTFATTAAATTWMAANAGNGSSTTGFTDYGGIALSTAQPILVTSKIQEQLSFCVYVTTCGTQAVINLGDAHDVLSISAPFVDNTTTYSLSTNASHGAVIYLEGPTLTSGSNTIPAAGSTAFLYATPSTNIDFFGVCTYNTSGETLTVPTLYQGTSNGGNCNTTVTDTGSTGVLTSLGSPYATFGFNLTNTTSTYGDLLATLVTPGLTVDQLALAAGVNVTQPSGIYTTTLQLIATGTY